MHELFPRRGILRRGQSSIETVSIRNHQPDADRTCSRKLTPAHSRKSKDDEGNSNDAAEDTGSRHLQRRESGTLGLASEQPAEDDALMDTASDAGSERPEARPTPSNGFSAINAGGGARTSDHAVAPMEFPPHARHDHPQQYHHSSSRARIQQLRWAGEQSTAFGSDITYTYYPYLAVDNLSNVPPQDISYLELQGCFRVPVKTTLDDFIKQFFLHVHPLMPLVNEGDFWELYGAQAGGTPVTEKLSLLLLQAMLFSACSVSQPSQDQRIYRN